MPPNSPDLTPLARRVRDNRITMDVTSRTALQHAENPNGPPLRGRIMSTRGAVYVVEGHDPFALFDALAAHVMANYEPAQDSGAMEGERAPGILFEPGGMIVPGSVTIAPTLAPSHLPDMHRLREMLTGASWTRETRG